MCVHACLFESSKHAGFCDSQVAKINFNKNQSVTCVRKGR